MRVRTASSASSREGRGEGSSAGLGLAFGHGVHGPVLSVTGAGNRRGFRAHRSVTTPCFNASARPTLIGREVRDT